MLHSSVEYAYEPELTSAGTYRWSLVSTACSLTRVSLYGTALWDRLNDGQKSPCSIHECSIARVGLWVEIIVMHMLLRYVHDRVTRSRHIQEALTETADQCRHSTMFARMTERYGVPGYPPALVRPAGRAVARATQPQVELAAAQYLWIGLLDQLVRELFGLERVDGVIDGLSVGEIDSAFGLGGGDLFSRAQVAVWSNAARNWRR